MHDLGGSDTGSVCKDILAAFQGVLAWEWDDRFGTVLAEFSGDQKTLVQEILERHFSIAWDVSNIEEAPIVVQAIDKHLGGMRSGQLLFNTHPNEEAFIFCACWPWGDGNTISIRMAPFDKRLSDREEAELIKRLKEWAESKLPPTLSVAF